MYKLLKVLLTPILSFAFILTCILVVLIFYFKLNFVWIIFVLYLINWIFIWVIFLSKRRTDVKVSWIFAISVFPIAGVIYYLLYGRKYKFRKNNKKYFKFHHLKIKYENHSETSKNLEYLKEESNNFYEVFKLSYSYSQRGIYSNSKLEILYNGENTWISIFDAIKNAKKYILINYFILGNGEMMTFLISLLETKLKEGVTIYFLYDTVGTYFQKNEYFIHNLYKLQKLGMHVHRFQKFVIPLVTGNVSYRNHRKDIVIDGEIGFTGGINAGDNYINLSVKYGLINDVHCKITGSSVRSLQLIFMNDWYFTTKQMLKELNNYHFNTLELLSKKKPENLNLIQVVDDGPIFKESIHKDILLKLISNSKDRIWISTPYFIPPEEIINQLIIAAKLGKDVRILIPGKTDKIFLLDLSLLYIKPLLKYGIKIYQTNNVFNHAKIFLFDDKISIVSTTNLDNRSLFVDYQTMVINYNQKINKEFAQKWEKYFELSILLDIDNFKNINRFYKLFLYSIKIFSPIL